jgi:cytochrome P450
MAIAVTFFLAAVVTLAVLLFRRRYETRSAMHRYQCAPQQKHWPKDVLFGLDFMFEMHSNLKMMKRNHDRFGPTYQVDTLFGDSVVNTIAPANLPLIHSDGKTYGIQPVRLPGMEYFCGKGFLTTDGAIWLQSRKMLRPSFAKQNISQLDFLSWETQRMLERIPTDGETIDLQPLFFVTVRCTYTQLRSYY